MLALGISTAVTPLSFLGAEIACFTAAFSGVTVARRDRQSGMVPLLLCLLPLPSFVFDPLTCVVWASSVSIYFTLIPGDGFCLPLDLLLWFVFCWVNKFWPNGKGLLRVVGVWPAWLPPSPTTGWLGIRLTAGLSPRQNGVVGSVLLHHWCGLWWRGCDGGGCTVVVAVFYSDLGLVIYG